MENAPTKIKLMDRITPKFLVEVKNVFRASGVKGVVHHFGWKIFAVFFVYYLVRDVCLYILLPWYIANKLV